MLPRIPGIFGRFGTVARRDTGTAAGQIPLLDSSARLPAVDASQLTNIGHSVCEGRLTLTTATAVTTGDVTAATNVYFTPFRGNRLGLYTGSLWVIRSFSEITISLSGLAADTNYDIFGYDNAGTVTVDSPLAWTNATTRATAVVLQDGVYVKSGDTTRRLLGTVRTTGTIGQCEDSLTKRFVSNAINRVRRPMLKTDSTASWTYGTSATWREANATTNRVNWVDTLGFDTIALLCSASVDCGSASRSARVGVGIDSTTAMSGLCSAGIANGLVVQLTGKYDGYPGAGFHFGAWLERQTSAPANVTFYGSGIDTVDRAGISGLVMA